MGRLTDSLRKASVKQYSIESGIDRMSSLSEDLAKNTANVADTSLKLGYAYAKAEKELTTDAPTQAEKADDVASKIVTLSQQLEKARSSQNTFQTWNDLYRLQQVLVQYLQEQVHQILKLKSIKQAPTLANKILNLAPSKILRLLKKPLKYKSHLLDR